MSEMLILPAEPLAVGRVVRVETGDTNSAAIEWLIPPQDDRAEIFEYPNHLLVNPLVVGPIVVGFKVEGKPSWITLTAGTAKRSWSWGWMKKLVPSWGTATKALPWLLALVLLAVVVTRMTPGPVNPINPPGPVDPPAPIAEKGFRTLVVYESADLNKLPPAQVSVITAKEIRDYLNLRCIDVGGRKEWRMWDKDEPTTNVSKLWQDAFAKVKASPGDYPKILISNGSAGFVGPLPANVDDAMKLLKTYGGV